MWNTRTKIRSWGTSTGCSGVVVVKSEWGDRELTALVVYLISDTVCAANERDSCLLADIASLFSCWFDCLFLHVIFWNSDRSLPQSCLICWSCYLVPCLAPMSMFHTYSIPTLHNCYWPNVILPKHLIPLGHGGRWKPSYESNQPWADKSSWELRNKYPPIVLFFADPPLFLESILVAGEQCDRGMGFMWLCGAVVLSPLSCPVFGSLSCRPVVEVFVSRFRCDRSRNLMTKEFLHCSKDIMEMWVRRVNIGPDQISVYKRRLLCLVQLWKGWILKIQDHIYGDVVLIAINTTLNIV